jgi:uncharacterized protein GlcG (DUF336 family)
MMDEPTNTSRLSLEQANRIIAATLAKARELALKPMGVAVVDAGGHLVAFAREDRTSTLRPQIALGKAAGAIALGISSRKIADMAAERPSFIAALGHVAPNGIIPAAGGVLIAGEGGQTIGAVGVTGDTSDNDELCALHGIAAAGLAAAG